MKYCFVCGEKNDNPALNTCDVCSTSIVKSDEPAEVVVADVCCVPKQVQVGGYISVRKFVEVKKLERRIAAEIVVQPEPEKSVVVSKPTNWLMLSMKLVQWTGTAVICLIVTFFIILFWKAFV